MRRILTLVSASCLSILSALPQAAAELPRFEITFDEKISNKPYTGRVFLIMTTSTRGDGSNPAIRYLPRPALPAGVCVNAVQCPERAADEQRVIDSCHW